MAWITLPFQPNLLTGASATRRRTAIQPNGRDQPEAPAPVGTGAYSGSLLERESTQHEPARCNDLDRTRAAHLSVCPDGTEWQMSQTRVER